MTKPVKIFTLCLWAVLLFTMVGVVAAKYVLPLILKAPAPEVMFPAEPYTLIDQNGASFSSATLQGRPYIASFMFTKCNGICPKMNLVIKGLQNDLSKAYHFVSITVDPANDDANALKAYAGAIGADETRWHFLTGDLATLQATALGMKQPNKDWPASHSDRLVLVDADGNIRGTYHTREAADIKKLIADAKAVADIPANPAAVRFAPPPLAAASAPATTWSTGGRP